MYYIDLAAVLAGVASVMRHGVPQRRDTFPNAFEVMITWRERRQVQIHEQVLPLLRVQG